MSLWGVIVAVAVISFCIKAAGPVIFADREFSPRTTAVIDALAPALLAGLVTVELLGWHWEGTDPTVLPGLGLAVLLRWVKVSEVVCVVVAVVVTIAVRFFAG